MLRVNVSRSVHGQRNRGWRVHIPNVATENVSQHACSSGHCLCGLGMTGGVLQSRVIKAGDIVATEYLASFFAYTLESFQDVACVHPSAQQCQGTPGALPIFRGGTVHRPLRVTRERSDIFVHIFALSRGSASSGLSSRVLALKNLGVTQPRELGCAAGTSRNACGLEKLNREVAAPPCNI